MNKIFAYAKIVLYILIFLHVGLASAVSGPSTAHSSKNKIVQFDISYKLFMALASYQELIEAENAGQNINKEILPVLEDIIIHIKSEKSKIKGLSLPENTTSQLKKVLKRMDDNIKSFSTELLFRQQLVELESLMEKQKKMLEEK